jgi:L-ascorbate metabolism protein UlaG (beta-lactamase superfamily)
MTTLRYLGVSAFEITNRDRVKIIVDPFISKNPICPVKLGEISRADLIVVTHGAADHMGDALELQKRTGATLVCGSDVRVHAVRNGVPRESIVSMLWGDRVEVRGIDFKCVECRHISFFQSGDVYLSGVPLSYVISPDPGVRIYNAGDTALFSDMTLIGQLYRPNLALMPIGGSPSVTGGFGHLQPYEAALATQWVGPDVVIPVHYAPDSGDVQLFAEHLRLLAPTVKLKVLKPGETWEFSAGRTADRT